ncbi:MAG: hypothetical protein ACOCXP_00305 [Candidatus Dojkabacteria bacterium]
MSKLPKVSKPALFIDTSKIGEPGYLEIAAATYKYFSATGAKAEFVFERNEQAAKDLKNLAGSSTKLQSEIAEKKFMLKIKKGGAEVGNVQWQQDQNYLNVYISVENGTLSARDLEFQTTGADYDLGVLFTTKELSSLGEIYKKNEDYFKKLTLFSIGSELNVPAEMRTDSSNNPSLSTLAEQALAAMDYDSITEQTAQLLYNGLIRQTKGLTSQIKSGEIFMNLKRLVDKGAKPEMATTE